MQQIRGDIPLSEEDIVSIKTLAKDPDIRKKIVNSIAPGIYGFEDIKEAIALQLFGGVSKSIPGGREIRGDIHILLLGDPSVGKSELLYAAVQTAQHGAYTFGDQLVWSWKNGESNVLSVDGIVAIDDLNRMPEEEQYVLAKAMESQITSRPIETMQRSIRVNGAVLTAANPKLGRIDSFSAVLEQMNLSPSLLSRFDLIFFMKDLPSSIRDKKIAATILREHILGEKMQIHERISRSEKDSFQVPHESTELDSSLLRKYIVYAKRNCIPFLSPEAEKAIIGYYEKLRSVAYESNNPIPITHRQVDSLVRLAEAYARMRLSSTISLEDAERAIHILDGYLRDVLYDPQYRWLDIDRILGGTTEAERILRRDVKEAIKNIALEKEEGYAEVDGVIHSLITSYSKKDIENMLNKLHSDGEVIMPREGILKLM